RRPLCPTLFPYTTLFRSWSREDSPFHDDYGLVFASANAEIVGYSIYKRLVLDGTPALYRAGAAVAVSHQRYGFYRMMSQAMLTRSEEHTSELQSRSDLVC